MKFRNTLSAEEKLSIYKTMKRIRLFERTVHKLITQNLAFGSIHFYTGEEAIAAGVCFCLKRKYGFEVEVIDLRTIITLDKEAILSSVKKTNKAAILHEAPRQGGFGGEIIAMIQEEAFDYLDSPILRICGPDTPVPYAPELEDFYVYTPERVAERIIAYFRL